MERIKRLMKIMDSMNDGEMENRDGEKMLKKKYGSVIRVDKGDGVNEKEVKDMI
jgi:signal recognition particle subunit SRP54